MTADPPTGPPAVSRFEYNLLRLLRFALGHVPVEQALPLVQARIVPMPGCLSPACVRLAERTLAKGVVLHLVRAGGWRRDRFLRNGKPLDGRVWDRVPLSERELRFSDHPLAFLKWLTAEKPTDAKEPWDAEPGELTPADELFFALAFDNLRSLPDVGPALSGKAAFRRNGLGWLLAPAAFAAPTGEPDAPDFRPWTTGPRAVFLECLQPNLARQWTRTEREKGQVEDWRKMRTRGEAEHAALSGLLAAVEPAGRPDLARFVLTTAAAVLRTPELAARFWTAGLRENRHQRLADRLATERAALALPRQLDALQRWDRKARSVGFFDEDYAASQQWKAEWEAARGDELATVARTVLGELEPLRAG